MPTTRAEKPQDLLPIIEDAINRADLDAFLAAHDRGATAAPASTEPVGEMAMSGAG